MTADGNDAPTLGLCIRYAVDPNVKGALGIGPQLKLYQRVHVRRLDA